jgi:hypothetical protein
MGWLGEKLPDDQQAGKTPFAPRCTTARPLAHAFPTPGAGAVTMTLVAWSRVC